MSDIEYTDIPEQPGAMSRNDSIEDMVSTSSQDPGEALKEAAAAVTANPSSFDLAEQIEQNNKAIEQDQTGTGANPPTSRAIPNKAPSGATLQYPSETAANNNNWIIFQVWQYARASVKPSSDATTTAAPADKQSGVTDAYNKLAPESVQIVTGQANNIKTIGLYMPHQVTTQYGAEWSEAEFGGMMGTAIDKAMQSGSVMEGLKTLPSSLVNKGAREGAASAIAMLPNMDAQDGQNILSKLTKKIENPRKEQLFRGISFRDFQYSFLFTPRSSQESNDIKEIVNTFKLYMHPDMSSTNDGMYLNYPEEFSIQYYHKTSVNDYLNKINRCALTNMSVDYAPFGQYATFKDGAPVAIRLNLAFRELKPLTKDDIKGGA